MTIVAKKKVIPLKTKIKAKKPVSLPSEKTKPLIKIADKIRGKVLNIEAVEAAKIAPPPAKKTAKSAAKESEFEIKKPKSAWWESAAAAEILFRKSPTG